MFEITEEYLTIQGSNFYKSIQTHEQLGLLFSHEDYFQLINNELIYRITAKDALLHLSILGYSSQDAQRGFDNSKSIFDANFESVFRDVPEDKELLLALKQLDFSTWQASIKHTWNEVIAHKVEYSNIEARDNPVVWLAQTFEVAADYGLQIEWLSILAIVLEDSPEDWFVDLHVIINKSCLDCKDIAECKQALERDLFKFDQKTIIMTEGTTDVTCLQKYISRFYPRVLKYYYFMDFEIAGSQGSTSFLTHYLKAFIGAGITNKIIALYDNDTAGNAEIQMLHNLDIPNNIRVFKLPNIEIANDYPTIGPTGMMNYNINGSAVSIEMFLGRKAITD